MNRHVDSRLGLMLSGLMAWECRDRSGTLKWQARTSNGVTTAGVNQALNAAFRGAATSLFYVGLIAQSGYVAVNVADTHDSHAGWAEWASYSGNRPVWVAGVPTGGNVGTSTPFSWVMSAAGQLRGGFLASSPTKGSAVGPTLYCTAVAGTALTVAVLDTVTATYICSLRN